MCVLVWEKKEKIKFEFEFEFVVRLCEGPSILTLTCFEFSVPFSAAIQVVLEERSQSVRRKEVECKYLPLFYLLWGLGRVKSRQTTSSRS